MARKPIHKTYQNLLQYYLSLYYVMRERNPGIKFNKKKHLHEIEKINKAYQKDLLKKYSDWDNETTREQLKKEIDFLTQVFSK